jgi:hypothetical protein
MRRIVIERLRIAGLTGRPPGRAEIEAALKRALAAQTVVPDTPPPRRVSGGHTLADAANALATALGGRKGGPG